MNLTSRGIIVHEPGDYSRLFYYQTLYMATPKITATDDVFKIWGFGPSFYMECTLPSYLKFKEFDIRGLKTFLPLILKSDNLKITELIPLLQKYMELIK